MKRPSLGFTLATVAGLAASLALLRATEWSDVHEAWTRLTPTRWAVGFVAYVAFVVIKSARFSVLLGGGFDRRELFGIVAAQTFWLNALPIRAGDLSYVLLMRRRAGVAATRGVASLLVASFLDLCSLLTLGAVLGFALTKASSDATVIRLLTLLCVVGVVCGAVAVVGIRVLPEAFWNRGASALGRVPVIGGSLFRLADELRCQTWSRSFVYGVAWSFLSLGSRFAFQVYLLNGMFGNITTLQGLFALTFAGVVNLLPIQGIANLGSIELPWAWAMTCVGVSTGDAVASGFALHAVVLLYSLGIGAMSLVLLGRARRDGSP
jgi:hypothetical protein